MKVILRKYSKHDYLTFCEWFFKRQMKPPVAYILPPVGMIVDGVGAGFLIETNCHVAMLDFFITNPDASAESRHEALEQITSSLIFYAAANDYKFIRADSSIESIQERAIARGFKKSGEYSVFWKEL